MIRAAVLALGLGLAGPAAAQDGDWPAIVSAEAATQDDIARMAGQFAHSGSLQLRRAQAALEANDDAAARAALWRFVRLGGVLSPGGLETVRPAFADLDWALFRSRMAANSAPVSRSRLAGEVPAELGLIEGIVHVPPGDNLLVSSVTERMIYGSGAAGWEPFVQSPIVSVGTGARAGSLMGMAFDAQRGWVWAASAIVDQTPDPQSAFAGLIGIAPGRNEVLWMPVAEGGRPGDLALGPDGAVYMSDAADGAIYVRSIGDVELERLVPPGHLRSPQGLAVSSDGSGLIVADYRYGLARIDLATGALDRLAYDGGEMLDGIDGMLRHRDALIAIRNGSAPNAILRIAVDPAGRRVESVEILERANPEWGEPTLGTIHGDTLYYIADARWDDFEAGGGLRNGAAPRPTTIRALPLAGGGN